MSERRRTKRAPCRLRCRVARGQDQIGSRIVDVSEGGLCLVLPVWLKPKQPYDVSIDVPGTGLAKVQIEIWHIRREESRNSKGRVWIAGAMILESDHAYSKLLGATGILSPDIESVDETATHEPKRIDPVDTVDPIVYRIRCKQTGGPRTRVLSLSADSEEQARALATKDLGSSWTVLDIREA